MKLTRSHACCHHYTMHHGSYWTNCLWHEIDRYSKYRTQCSTNITISFSSLSKINKSIFSHSFFLLVFTLPETPAGYCILLVSSFFLYPAGDSGRVLFLTRFFFLSSFFLSLPCRWLRQGLVSHSFLLSFFLSSFFLLSFFLLSGNTSFSHTSLHPILTKLSQSDRYLDHYSGTDNGGVRGHDGVTGVKKVIFIKKASSPTEYLALTRDLCICSSLTPSTKVMVLKNCQGSFGVTGVKSSFSQKRHQVLRIM